MKLKLIIDKTQEEQIVATLHERSGFTEQLEMLVLQHNGADRIAAYDEDDMRMLPVADIECITIMDGKTFAIDGRNRHYRLKQRLYELEAVLPSSFIRINKSALANEAKLERFVATFSGGVDAVFQCGYTEYVSRRCFTEIKRRYEK